MRRNSALDMLHFLFPEQHFVVLDFKTMPLPNASTAETSKQAFAICVALISPH